MTLDSPLYDLTSASFSNEMHLYCCWCLCPWYHLESDHNLRFVMACFSWDICTWAGPLKCFSGHPDGLVLFHILVFFFQSQLIGKGTKLASCFILKSVSLYFRCVPRLAWPYPIHPCVYPVYDPWLRINWAAWPGPARSKSGISLPPFSVRHLETLVAVFLNLSSGTNKSVLWHIAALAAAIDWMSRLQSDRQAGARPAVQWGAPQPCVKAS